MTPGLLIAAPASGSGKTVLTLALLRHYRNAGRAVASIKVGPDYIDPAFHAGQKLFQRVPAPSLLLCLQCCPV